MFFGDTHIKFTEPTDETHCDLETKSILKPPKARLPLQEVDFGFDNTIDPDVIRKRRVSFAGIKIKEFNSKAESVIIGSIQAYEETFSTSSDSSALTTSCSVGGSSSTGDDYTILNDTMELTDIEKEPGNMNTACKEKAIFPSDDFCQNNPPSFHPGLHMQNINLMRGGSDLTKQHMQPLYDPSKLLVKALLEDSNILEDMSLVQHAKIIPQTFFPEHKRAEPSAMPENNFPCYSNPFMLNPNSLKNEPSSKFEKPLFSPFINVHDAEFDIGNKSGMEFTGALPKFEFPQREPGDSLTHNSCFMGYIEAIPSGSGFVQRRLQQHNIKVEENKQNHLLVQGNIDEMDFTETIPGFNGFQGNREILSKENKNIACDNKNTILESSYAMDFTEVLQPNTHNNVLPHAAIISDSQNINTKEREQSLFFESSQMHNTEAVVLPLTKNRITSAPCTASKDDKENYVGLSNSVDSNNLDYMEASQMEFTEALPDKFRNREDLKNAEVNVSQNSVRQDSFNMEITQAIPNKAFSSKINEHLALSEKIVFQIQKEEKTVQSVMDLTEAVCFQKNNPNMPSNCVNPAKQMDFFVQSKQIEDLASRGNSVIHSLSRGNDVQNTTQMEFTEVIPQMRPADHNFEHQTFHRNENYSQMEFTEVIRPHRKSGICLEEISSCNPSSNIKNNNKHDADVISIGRQGCPSFKKETENKENIYLGKDSPFNQNNNKKCHIGSENMSCVNKEPQTGFFTDYKLPESVNLDKEVDFSAKSKQIEDFASQGNSVIHSLSKGNDVQNTTQMEFTEVIPQMRLTDHNFEHQTFHSDENYSQMEFTEVIRPHRKPAICLEEMASCNPSSNIKYNYKHDADVNSIGRQSCPSFEKETENKENVSQDRVSPFNQNNNKKCHIGSENMSCVNKGPQTGFFTDYKLPESINLDKQVDFSAKSKQIEDFASQGNSVIHSLSKGNNVQNTTQMEFTEVIPQMRLTDHNFEHQTFHRDEKYSQMEFTEVIRPNRKPAICLEEISSCNPSSNIKNNNKHYADVNSIGRQGCPSFEKETENKENISLGRVSPFNQNNNKKCNFNLESTPYVDIECQMAFLKDHNIPESVNPANEINFSTKSNQINDLQFQENPVIHTLSKENDVHNATQMEFTEVIPQMRPTEHNYEQQNFHINNNFTQMEFTEVIRPPRKTGIFLQEISSCISSSSIDFGTNKNNNEHDIGANPISRQICPSFEKETVNNKNISQDTVSHYNKNNIGKFNRGSENMSYLEKEQQTVFFNNKKLPESINSAKQVDFSTKSNQIKDLPSQDNTVMHLLSKENNATQMEFTEVIPQTRPPEHHFGHQTFHMDENFTQMEFTEVIRPHRKTGICLQEISSCNSSSNTDLGTKKHNVDANPIRSQICPSSENETENEQITSQDRGSPSNMNTNKKCNVDSMRTPYLEPQTFFFKDHKQPENKVEERLKDQCFTDIKSSSKNIFAPDNVVNTSQVDFTDMLPLNKGIHVPNLQKKLTYGVHGKSGVCDNTQMDFTDVIPVKKNVNDWNTSVEMETAQNSPRRKTEKTPFSVINSNLRCDQQRAKMHLTYVVPKKIQEENGQREIPPYNTPYPSTIERVCENRQKNSIDLKFISDKPGFSEKHYDALQQIESDKHPPQSTDLDMSVDDSFSACSKTTDLLTFDNKKSLVSLKYEVPDGQAVEHQVSKENQIEASIPEKRLKDSTHEMKNDYLKKINTPAKSSSNEVTRKMKRLDEEWNIIQKNRSFFNKVNFHWISPVRWKHSLPFPLDVVVQIPHAEISLTSRNIINIKLQSTIHKHDWFGSVEDCCMRTNLSLILSEDWMNKECKTMKDLLMAIEIIEEEYERLKPLIASLRFVALKRNPWRFKDNQVVFSLASISLRYHIVIKVNVLNYQKLSGDDIVVENRIKEISQREVRDLFDMFEPSRERFLHFIEAVKERLSSN